MIKKICFHKETKHVRTSHRPRPARHNPHLQILADRSPLPHDPEQPRPGSGRTPAGPGRLRRARPGRPQLGIFRRHPRVAQEPGRRRDPAGAIRQAGGGLQDPPGRAARPDRQLQPGAALGHLGALRRAGRPGSDHVRPDDRRFVDLHRHAGHPAGHLRDLWRAGQAQGLGLAQGQVLPDRRSGRDGRRAAAGHHHERGRRPDRRSGPGACQAPPRHGLCGPGGG